MSEDLNDASSAYLRSLAAKITELNASRQTVTSIVMDARWMLCCSRNSSGTMKPSSTGTAHAEKASQPLIPVKGTRGVSRGLSEENSVTALRRP